MSLAQGTRLGPYEIEAPIGGGGMGEVYKARDTRLERSVAIKVLPPAFSADPDRRARFEREAKTIAGLTHPHICTLYDVGEYEGSTFLVMEHLTGETLAQRLEKGPLPLEQALSVATEITDALAAAHRQGVIHRDLKPGNVMLTKAGAKLLDFGLAKLKGHGEQPAAAHLATAPTQSTPLTGEGMIVGTLQYMAPEQLEGKPADARTDLWALGAILYEMVTGKRAFEGTSAASLIGKIVHAEPLALLTLQPLTPSGVDLLVRRCLAKDPEDRWQSAHDAADQLRWTRETAGVRPHPGVQWRHRWALRVAILVATGLLLFAAGATLTWRLRPGPPAASLMRLSLDVRPAEDLNAGGVEDVPPPRPGGSRTALTWTPDGQALVFVGRRDGVQQLYVRRLNAVEARPLAGTEGAQVPAVSADGQWVAFYAHPAIRKVPLAGGPVIDLVPDVETPWGLVWDDRGRLFFGRNNHDIWMIPPEGAPARVTSPGEAEASCSLPWPLPGGQTLLYTVRKRYWSWGDEEVVAQTLATGNRRVLLKEAADARYVPTGHLVFLRRGILFGVAFDAERLEVRGPEVPLLGTVAQALSALNADDVTGAGQFAIGATGMLAWVSGPVLPPEAGTLVTVDRRGQVAPLPAPVRSYLHPVRVSPDGRRLVVTVETLTEVGVWLYDLGHETLTPVNLDGEFSWPIWWRPTAQRLVFDWVRGGRGAVAAQPADGTAAARPFVAGAFQPSSFTPDGRKLAGVSLGHVVVATVGNGEADAQRLWQTSANERWPEFSPDGRWLAYGLSVSGRWEVYVRSYPDLGPAQQVSIEAGRSPAWHPTGRELFFLSALDPTGKRRMMAADFVPGPSTPPDASHGGASAGTGPSIGRPRALFEFDDRDLGFDCAPVRCYDLTPDGQRFYVVQSRTPPRPPVVTHINLILNWFEELKAKVPGPR